MSPAGPRTAGRAPRVTRRWVARRRVVRRRRLLALAALGAVLAIAVAAVALSRGSGDAFVGSWSATGVDGRVVITHVGGPEYTVVVGAGHKARVALRSGDRLTVAASPGATQGAIVLEPGPGSGTLEESFPDGTTATLTRGR